MKKFTKQLRVQLKLFMLDRINWALPVLSLILLFTNIGYKENDAFSPRYINLVASNIFLYISIVYGALATRFFIMETSFSYQMQWTKPGFRKGFVLIKFLAMLIGVSLFLLPTLVILLVRGLPYNHLGGLLEGAEVWFYIYIPTFLFVTVLSVLVGLLIRVRILASGITLFILIGMAIHQTTWSDLLRYTTSEFYNIIFGFGPGRESLFFNRAYFLALSLTMLLAVILIAHYRLPSNKGQVSRVLVLGWAVLFLLAVSGTVLVGSRLNYLGKHLVAKPDLETLYRQESFCDGLQNYIVDLEINTEGQIERGVAGFQVSSRLNPKDNILLLRSLTENQMDIKESLPGNYQIDYSGKFILPNYSYTSFIQDPEISLAGFLPGAFMDHSKLFLLAHGQWHPFAKCDLDELTLTIPSEFDVNYVSSTSQFSVNGKKVFFWEGEFPEVLIIAGGNYENSVINGREALLPRNVDLDTFRVYELYENRIRQFWEVLYGDEQKSPDLVILPIVRTNFVDNSGHFYQSYIPVPLTLPNESPAKLEVEAALEIIQTWWAEGKDDPTLRICLFDHLPCYFPTRSNPEDKSIIPLLYYASIKFAADQNPSVVNLNEIITQYQSIKTDPNVVFALPRTFIDPTHHELLLKIAEIDQCLDEEEFWAALIKVRDSSTGVWMDHDALVSSIKSTTGFDLDDLEIQCPQK